MSEELENSNHLAPDSNEPKEVVAPNFDPYQPFEAQAEPPHAPKPPHAPDPPREKAPGQPARVRRVGTLTMGAALIVSGVVALISLFNPSFNFIMAAKLSPLVLVFIGIEILYYNFFHQNEKLKYDFLSTFVCFLLICTSVTVAMLSPIYEQYGPPRNAAQNRIEAEIQDAFVTSLSGMPISSLQASVYLERPIKEAQPLTYNDLIPADHVAIEMTLAGNYTDKQQFAKACKSILDKITASAIPYDRITLQSPVSAQNTFYWLEVNDKFRAALSAQQLAQVVDDNRMQQEIQQAYEEIENQRQQLNENIEQQREQLDVDMQIRREDFGADMQRQQEELANDRQQQNEDIERQREELENLRQQQNDEIQRQREELNTEIARLREELNKAS